MLEKEARYFDSQLMHLINTNLGKYVLIKGEKTYGIFEAIADALNAGYEKFNDQPFFIRHITPTQEPLNFANNSFLA